MCCGVRNVWCIQLDEVSAGHANWKALLAKFWPEFHENVLAAMKIPIDKVPSDLVLIWFLGFVVVPTV